MGDPIKLTEDQRKRLMDYIIQETKEATDWVHDPLSRKRNLWEDTYYGRVKPRMEDWMSNFPILLGATFVDAILARLMNTQYAYKPTWTVEPTLGGDWTHIAKSVESFLEYKVRTEMQLFREDRKAMFEAVKHGMGILLTPWIEEYEQRKVKFMFWEREVAYPVVNGVRAEHLPLRDFFYPAGYAEPEKLPWWSRRLYWTPAMLRYEKALGNYEVSDKVMSYLEEVPEFTQDAMERSGELSQPKRIIGMETWLKWDLLKEGKFKRYVVTWHQKTEELIRIEEDTYPKWPLSVYRYGPRDQGLSGLGVLEMTQPYEDGLYALYNLLVDNYKLATMQVFGVKKGSGGIRQNTKIYPGKILFLDNPETDFLPKSMGQPYQLNPAFLRSVWDLGERRTGISDYALGRESPIVSNKATATGTIALIQEGQRRHDLTIHDLRETKDAQGMFVLRITHQRTDSALPYMLQGPKGQWMQQWLKLPDAPPELFLRLVSSMSSLSLNKETRKQDAATTYQLLGGYYERMVQLIQLMMSPQVAQNPELATTLINIAKAASEKTKDVLEAYGEPTPELFTQILPEKFYGQTGPQTGQAGVQQGAGGAQVPPGMAVPGGEPGPGEGEVAPGAVGGFPGETSPFASEGETGE